MIVLAAWPAGIASLGVPIALETSLGLPIAMKRRAEAVVVPDIVARNEGIGRRPARYEATLGLIAQHRDKLGAIVGLGAQRFVRDDDRGSRQCGRPDAIEHILRDDDAVERVLGVVPLVNRDRGPTKACTDTPTT